MFQRYQNKGFSLIELLVAGSVGAALVLFMAQYLKINDTSNRKIQSDLEDTSDNLNMEVVLRKDLTNAQHSLNNMNVTDDNGSNFFDYLSSSSCTTNCSRSIKIQAGSKAGEISKKSLYFIIINSGAGDQQIYNPSDAYEKGTLNFKSLNQGYNLSIRPSSPWNDNIKVRSTLMFLYSPIEIFSPSLGISAPGRMMSFMGWAGANNYTGTLDPESIYDNGKTYYKNDDLRTNGKINNEDKFFQNMPYTTGLGSFAFLTPVKVVRYRLMTVAVSGKLTGQLLRGVMNEKHIFDEKPVGFNIKSLEFSRPTISSPGIYIKIDNTK